MDKGRRIANLVARAAAGGLLAMSGGGCALYQAPYADDYAAGPYYAGPPVSFSLGLGYTSVHGRHFHHGGGWHGRR